MLLNYATSHLPEHQIASHRAFDAIALIYGEEEIESVLKEGVAEALLAFLQTPEVKELEEEDVKIFYTPEGVLCREVKVSGACGWICWLDTLGRPSP